MKQFENQQTCCYERQWDDTPLHLYMPNTCIGDDEKAETVPNEVNTNREGNISIKFLQSGVSVAFKRNKHKYRMEFC